MLSCEVKVWGVRGSLPAPGAPTIRYGGNTSCITMEVAGEPLLIIDGGTGITRISPVSGDVFNLLLSHLHWDHTMGLPFFRAGDRAGAQVNVYGPAGDSGLRAGLDSVVCPPGFPITIDGLCGRWDLHDLGDETVDLGAFRVMARHLRHRGPTLGFRIEVGGHVLAYLSDHGPGAEGRSPEQDDLVPESVLELVRGADVLFHDSQHTEDEYARLRHFGHSTPAFAVKVALAGEVGSLLLFHHDPGRGDDELDVLADGARRLAAAQGFGGLVRAAAEGDSFVLGQAPDIRAASPD
ncbi:MAG TPA: MBL fold metallo-hydrolase [Acidimicrobiales bacterium]|nr:MBL fold metallo-hydrolase [Acidimicrobiales bacterium]